MDYNLAPQLNLLKHFDLNHNVTPPRASFKAEKSFISRKEEVMAIRSKYPTKIPLIVEKYHREKKLPTLTKVKFLVPEDFTMSQFLVIIRNRIKVTPTQALYLLINNRSMLSMSLTMAQAYQAYAEEDGFLYITYASQDVLGYQDEMTGHDLEAIRNKFPNKIPLYVERHTSERRVPALGRNKYLVPQELTMSQFMYILRVKIKLKESQALYLLLNNKVLPSNTLTMAQAYDMFRTDDGLLHVTYAAQPVFG